MSVSRTSRSESSSTRPDDVPDELLDETLFDRMKRRLGGLPVTRKSGRLSSAAMDISNLSMNPQFESTRMSFNLGQDDRTTTNSPDGKAIANRSKRRSRKTKMSLLDELREDDEDDVVKKKPRLSQAVETQGNQPNGEDVGNTFARSSAAEARKNQTVVEGHSDPELREKLRHRQEKTTDISLSRGQNRESTKQAESFRVTRARSVHVPEQGEDESILRRCLTRPSAAREGQGEVRHDSPYLEEPSPSKVYRMKMNLSSASTSRQNRSRDSSRVREVDEEAPGNRARARSKGYESLNRTRGSVFVPETCPDVEEEDEEEMPGIDDVTVPETQLIPGNVNEDSAESVSEPVRPRQSNRSRKIVESESEYARSIRSGRVTADNSDAASASSTRASRKSTNSQRRSSGRERDGTDAREMEVDEVSNMEPMPRNVQENIANQSGGVVNDVSRRTGNDSSPSVKKITQLIETPSKVRKERVLTPNKRRVSPRKRYAPLQDSPRVQQSGNYGRNDEGELALQKQRVTPGERYAPAKEISPRFEDHGTKDDTQESTINKRRVSPRKKYHVQDSPRYTCIHGGPGGDADNDRMSKTIGQAVERQDFSSPKSVKNARIARAGVYKMGDKKDDEIAVNLPEPQEREKEMARQRRRPFGSHGKARRMAREETAVDDDDDEDTTEIKPRRHSRKKLSVVQEEIDEHFGFKFDATADDCNVDADRADDNHDEVNDNGSADDDDDVPIPLVDNANYADDTAVSDGDDDCAAEADDRDVDALADEEGDENVGVDDDVDIDDDGNEGVDDDYDSDDQQNLEDQGARASAPLIDEGGDQSDSDKSSSISQGLRRGDRVGLQNVGLENASKDPGQRLNSIGTAFDGVAEEDDDDVGDEQFVVNDDESVHLAVNRVAAGKDNLLEDSSRGFMEKRLDSGTQEKRGRTGKPDSFEISGIEPVARDEDNAIEKSTGRDQKSKEDGNASHVNTTKGGKAKKKRRNIPATTVHVDVRQHMKDRDFIHQQLDILAMPINPTDPLVVNVYNKLTAQNVIDEHPLPKDTVQKVFDKVNKKVYEEVHGAFNPKEIQAMLTALDEVRGSTRGAGIDVDRTEKQLVALNVERVLETLPMSWPSTDRGNAAVERYNKLRRHVSKLLTSIEDEKKDRAQYKVSVDMVREIRSLQASLDMNELVKEVKRSQHLASQFTKLKKFEKRARSQESFVE